MRNASLEVVDSSCVRSPSRSPFSPVLWVQPRVRAERARRWPGTGNSGPPVTSLPGFCLRDLGGGWGLILIPFNFMCPELVAVGVLE